MKIFLILVLVLGVLQAFAGVRDSTVTGKTINGERTGPWKYYDADHHLIKLERYRHGTLRQTYIYNEKGRVITRINRKGKVVHYRACGC
jgi:YD repeat-containing protein